MAFFIRALAAMIALSSIGKACSPVGDSSLDPQLSQNGESAGASSPQLGQSIVPAYNLLGWQRPGEIQGHEENPRGLFHPGAGSHDCPFFYW